MKAPNLVRLKTTGCVTNHNQNNKTCITKRKCEHVRRFSISHSTEELFKSTDDFGFYGAYGHIRSRLDYTYHRHYRKERQWLHDSIIGEYLENGSYMDPNSLPVSPWLILTAGCQGAGKRYVVDTLVEQGRLPLLSTLSVDTDEIRQLLPEYSSYVQDSPVLLDHLTQKEAGYIAETLVFAALQAGRNVILDSSLADAEWYRRELQQLRSEFPVLKTAVFHVTAEPAAVLERAAAHSKETGRTIPADLLLRRLSRIPQSVDMVKPVVDYACTIHNGEELELMSGGDWNHFYNTFQQTREGDSLGKRIPKLERMSSSLSSSQPEEQEEQQQEQVPPRERRRHRRQFSVLRSSEENHAVQHRKFYGAFAHIRKTLDYSYHSNYTFERQLFQDAIVNEFLYEAIVTDANGEECPTPTEPWIVFTAGAMGAGKSFTMKKLAERGLFPLRAFIRADPDEIRRYMPEFNLYVQQCPEMAGQLTRKEAGYITEILTKAALQAGKNVLVDGSLRDAAWYQRYFMQLRMNYTDIRLAIIHVSAPPDCVFQRAEERGIITGRIVPRELLSTVLEKVPESVKRLAPLVDYHVEISNTDDVEIVRPEQETWDTFKANWIQRCAWKPMTNKMIKRASKVSLTSLASHHSNSSNIPG